MRNLRLDLCYDGTRYKGWQRLSTTDNTIQCKLETTLGRILGEEIEVIGSGRTDAGTHAACQVTNVHCNSTLSCEEILRQLCQYLPEDIGVYSCRNVSERFHARLNAKTKTYVYRLWNSEKPCVFDRKYVYKDAAPLDVEAMRKGAMAFIGTHDFSAFCANKNMKKSTVRHISSFCIDEVGMNCVSLLPATAFCTIWCGLWWVHYWRLVREFVQSAVSKNCLAEKESRQGCLSRPAGFV